MPDFLFRGKLADLDQDVYDLTQLEAERQARKLILIAQQITPTDVSALAAYGSKAGDSHPLWL